MKFGRFENRGPRAILGGLEKSPALIRGAGSHFSRKTLPLVANSDIAIVWLSTWELEPVHTTQLIGQPILGALLPNEEEQSGFVEFRALFGIPFFMRHCSISGGDRWRGRAECPCPRLKTRQMGGGGRKLACLFQQLATGLRGA